MASSKGFLFPLKSLHLGISMIPDYPHKIFGDKRCSYTLLMQMLAMDVS